MGIKNFNIKKNKKWMAGGCVAGILVLAVTGWTVFAGGKSNDGSVDIVPSEARKMDLSKSIQGTGVLEPENSADVKVPTGIRITEIKVKVGDEVKAGDVLALTDGGTVTASLLEAKEKLAETDKKLRQTNNKTSAYYNLANDKKNLEEKINILNQISQSNSITAAANGTVTAVNGAAGEVNKSSSQNGGSGSTPGQQNPSSGNSSGTPQNQSAGGNLSDISLVNLTEAGENENKEPVTMPFPELKLKAPVTGEPQLREIEETDGYTGKIEWNHVADKFEEKTVYAARITLTAKPGFVFEKGAEPKIEGAAISDVEYAGDDAVHAIAFTAVFPATEANGPAEEPSDPSAGDKNEDDPGEQQKPSDEGDKNTPQEAGEAEDGFSGGGFSAGASFGGGSAGGSGSGDEKSVNTELADVFTISSGDKMKVSIQIDEMDILSVSMGQKAVITLNALPGEVFEGKITHINKVGTANSGVTKYKAEITAAKNDKMLSGMNVAASVVVEEKKDVTAVPAFAVFEEGGKSYVYTGTDKKTGELTGKKEVTTGMTDGVYIEIIKGIKEGTAVYFEAMADSSPGNVDVPAGVMSDM